MNNEDSQQNIPTSKVARASKIVSTGVKVGGNYIKHYAKKAFNNNLSKGDLDKANAEDIYEALSQLKGSALKMAQIISMDKSTMPTEYIDQFQKAQYQAPPLSGPLIVNTFKKTMGKKPLEIFDEFDEKAANAASIGQVHIAKKNGQKLAVKIQYPGVADSIVSDLKMVKPFALRLMKVKEADIKPYFDEVQSKLLEEADYKKELQHSIQLSEACKHLPNLVFSRYYPEMSSDRVITMDWIDGTPITEWLKTNPSQEDRNKIGQAMWNLYDFQMNHLKILHADPHPGNFLITPTTQLAVIDFGCIKEVSDKTRNDYFAMLDDENFTNREVMIQKLVNLEILQPTASEEEKDFFVMIFQLMMGYLRQPFLSQSFDFGNDEMMKEMMAKGEEIGKSPEAKKFSSARGSRHILYINRTFFGLFSMLNQMKAVVVTENSFGRTFVSAEPV
jgi:predicted unusual protein kinase regulating ubiquinone biosynthesis (AarF/ABC1/UbiB family)